VCNAVFCGKPSSVFLARLLKITLLQTSV